MIPTQKVQKMPFYVIPAKIYHLYIYLLQKGPKYAKWPNYIINIEEIDKIYHTNDAYPEMAKILHTYCSYPKGARICDALCLPTNCQNIP